MMVDLLPVVESCLIGAVSVLSSIVWQQRRAIEALQADRLAIENRLGTIQQQTCVDALTGLRNQQMFEIRISALLRSKVPFALIYIDLDGLKAENDRRGHTAGDRMIRSAAKAIRSAVGRRYDLDSLFRRSTAADEFLWVLEGSPLSIGVDRAEQILTALQSIGVSASIGVMEWDAQTIASCVEIELAAEQQMQRAKREGRNRVCAQGVFEHMSPVALPNNTQSVPEAIPNELAARIEVTDCINVAARIEVTERYAA